MNTSELQLQALLGENENFATHLTCRGALRMALAYAIVRPIVGARVIHMHRRWCVGHLNLARAVVSMQRWYVRPGRYAGRFMYMDSGVLLGLGFRV